MIQLPDLAYGYGDLAPVISETTLRIHHGKHHARYVQVTNDLLAQARAPSRPLEAVVIQAKSAGAQKLFNNAAQAWNHGFFWVCMRPGGGVPGGDLAKAIEASFGSVGELRKVFVAEGAAHFGSGWVWLTVKDGLLAVQSTHDAGLPLTEAGFTPLLVCDLWEHAYYLDPKNDRAGFLDAWWDLLANWDFADSQYTSALSSAPTWRYPAATGNA
jgi:Fe-Mn family superoxide dismutase